MDYKSLGLKCGLEIHQQLEGKKLFCSCQGSLTDEPADITVRRILRAVPGEHGEIDVAAIHEQLKGKIFVYEGSKNTNCMVELDEEPPHTINNEALEAALEIALLLKAKIADKIQIMRKTVIDGSNTGGFQRTALIAFNGKIQTREGDVSIPTICIEEDSARQVSSNSKEIVYRLDRLGIPLVEIGTAPDIKTPEQCLEVAEKLGMLLRSTGKVKRGIGTIRQDVNISIKDGARVEIKGTQELKLLPVIVENEVLRQLNLINIRDELRNRNMVLKKEVYSFSDLFKSSESHIIKNALANNGVVLGMKLSGFAGLIGKEIQPNRRLGTEFSDRAKVRAGVGGISHSDELPKYGITVEEVRSIRQRLQCKENDAFVLIASDMKKAQIALEAVFERASEALNRVLSEVRRALPDGTTSYLRPMPGAARMYPETDTPIITPSVKKIKLPEMIEHKIGRYLKLGLDKELAEQTAKSGKAHLFEELVKKYKIKPSFIAEVLTSRLTEFKRDYGLDDVDENLLRDVFRLLHDGKISKDVISQVIMDMSKCSFDISKYTQITDDELKKTLKQIKDENKWAPFGALMGIAVSKLKGKASGQRIAELLRNLN